MYYSTKELFASHALAAQFSRGDKNRLSGIIECYDGDILLLIDGFSLLARPPEDDRKFMVCLGLLDRTFPRNGGLRYCIADRFPGLFKNFALPPETQDTDKCEEAAEKTATLRTALRQCYPRKYTEKHCPGLSFLFTTATFPLKKLDELRAILTEKYGEGELVGDIWMQVRPGGL